MAEYIERENLLEYIQDIRPDESDYFGMGNTEIAILDAKEDIANDLFEIPSVEIDSQKVKTIWVVNEEDHGDIIYSDSRKHAIDALIKYGWLDEHTELRNIEPDEYGVFHVKSVKDWLGADWETKIYQQSDYFFYPFVLREEVLYSGGEG